jgi:hypothetical protein
MGDGAGFRGLRRMGLFYEKKVKRKYFRVPDHIGFHNAKRSYKGCAYST